MDQPNGKKPALTVVIQSWWTPALAVVSLLVGVFVGFLIFRPHTTNTPEPTGIAAAANTPVNTKVPSTPSDANSVPTATIDPTLAAINSNAQLMDYLVANTTHFEGDPNAPVTIIEFSDYQ